MGRIRCRNTKPEMRVRRMVHGLGYRYRLHQRNLPGTPDLVFPGQKKAIFVHGCFWHQHTCPRGVRPDTNREFWENKLDQNIQRDLKNIHLLKKQGWSVLILWECEIKKTEALALRINEFLSMNE